MTQKDSKRDWSRDAKPKIPQAILGFFGYHIICNQKKNPQNGPFKKRINKLAILRFWFRGVLFVKA